MRPLALSIIHCVSWWTALNKTKCPYHDDSVYLNRFASNIRVNSIISNGNYPLNINVVPGLECSKFRYIFSNFKWVRYLSFLFSVPHRFFGDLDTYGGYEKSYKPHSSLSSFRRDYGLTRYNNHRRYSLASYRRGHSLAGYSKHRRYTSLARYDDDDYMGYRWLLFIFKIQIVWEKSKIFL